MANPTLLTSPIAENGDKNVIPASTGATTGLLDQEHGFQQINELPLQAGGLPPQRKDFNGVFNLLSGILYMAQRGYTFEYDNTLPYVVGCIVVDPLDGKIYRCINDVSAGGFNPSADATNWKPYDCLPLDGGGTLTGTSLTWNGNNLGDNAIVARSLAQTPGYIKFASGFMFQWLRVIYNTGEDTKTVQYPISFTSNCVITTGVMINSRYATILSFDNTEATIRINSPSASDDGVKVNLWAIGY